MTDPRSAEIVKGLGDASNRQESQAIVEALRAHRATASGSAAVPAVDPVMSTKLMAEARTRSQEIRLAASGPIKADRPIPWWLWLAWAAAIAAFVGLWMWVR